MTGKPIVLIGPMGVGKTTIGKKLAKRLEIPFVDTDLKVSAKYGDVPTIFKEHGEDFFRKVEEEAVSEALLLESVIATGGGAVLSANNQRELAKATVVYLETDGKHIMSRLRKGNRPLIKNGFDDWQRIYESRRAIYEQLADITVNTSKQGLRSIVDEICGKLDRT